MGGEDREGRAGAGLAELSGEGLQLVGRGQEGGATACDGWSLRVAPPPGCVWEAWGRGPHGRSPVLAHPLAFLGLLLPSGLHLRPCAGQAALALRRPSLHAGLTQEGPEEGLGGSRQGPVPTAPPCFPTSRLVSARVSEPRGARGPWGQGPCQGVAFSDSAPAEGLWDTALQQDEPEALVLHWPHLAGGSGLRKQLGRSQKSWEWRNEKPQMHVVALATRAVGTERPRGSPEWRACPWRSPQEGAEFAASRGLLFTETSARLNHRVTEAFSAVGE